MYGSLVPSDTYMYMYLKGNLMPSDIPGVKRDSVCVCSKYSERMLHASLLLGKCMYM